MSASPCFAFGPAAGDVLAIVRAGVGDTHAAYPDATRTLCGASLDEHELEPVLVDPAGDAPPSCDVCRAVARAFNDIDGSAPPTWFRSRR